jgi:uncharacterized membrane protein (DUF373 family)
MPYDRRSTDEVHQSISYLTRALNVVDTVILILVAFGIVGIAGSLLYEALTDALFFWSSHSIPHIISELMFTLIIMELFRQVLRQINKKPFSLNPFLFIGFIASIRGILLTQMSLSLGDLEWKEGITQVGVHVTVLLILVVCYSIYAKVQIKKKEAGIPELP